MKKGQISCIFMHFYAFRFIRLRKNHENQKINISFMQNVFADNSREDTTVLYGVNDAGKTTTQENVANYRTLSEELSE